MSGKSKIPPDYKKTEIGIIPEDWEVKRLKDIGVIKTGGTPSTSIKKFWNGNIIWVTPTDINKRKEIRQTERKISEEGLKIVDELPPNTLLVTCIASIGKNAIMKERGTCNQQINAIIPSENYDPDFLYYLMENNSKKLLARAGMTATPIISKKEFSQLLFAFPSTIEEQRAIANVLSDFDKLIESLDKLIEKKKLIKKGTMQQLLTGKKRLPGFTGEWVRKKLGEIFFITRGLVLATKYMKKERIGKYRFPVYSSQTQNNGVIGFYDKFLYEDAITWTTDGANAGDVKFRKGKFYCTNVCGVLLNEEGYSNQCIAEIFGMVSKKYVSYVGNPKLMNNVVKNIEITFPPTLSEQRAIAQILSDMDAEIEALERKKQKYEMMKKAAMELLLTGKVRLKFNNKK